MKLVNDIINELVDSEKSISAPLLKTKVLASRLNNTELLKWVSNELKGYSNDEEIPDYRTFQVNLTGTYINGNMQYNNQPVPTIGLGEEIEKAIRTMTINQSASALETMKGKGKGVVELTLPAELTGLIERNWRKMGNPYLQLVNCKKTMSGNVINEVLSTVRNNLLDFMLKIDSEFGNVTEIEELKTKKEEIATIMSQTIINNTGDGNVLNTGDKAKITATINISKGDKEQLSKHLKEIGLENNDVEELVQVIDTEQPENETFGPKVNSWTQKMLGKALDGSWKIGVGAAGSLLAEAIKTYYGM